MTVGLKFKKPVHCPPASTDKLIIPYAKVGIEVEVENWDRAHSNLVQWEDHEDGSLRRGREFTTRGGMVGKQIVEEIETICNFAKSRNYSEGYPRAGIHLHIDMTDMNDGSDTQLLNAIAAYMLFEDAMFSFAGEWRKACGFCDPLLLSQASLGAMAKLLIDWESVTQLSVSTLDKYQAVNLIPLHTFGTIEFRALPTTFDSKRILDWTNLCLAFKKFGKDIDKNPVMLLDKLGVEGLAKAIFLDWYPVIQKHINVDAVHSAATQVKGLSVGMKLKNKKLSPIQLDWNEPDNPILALKSKGKGRIDQVIETSRAIPRGAVHYS